MIQSNGPDLAPPDPQWHLDFQSEAWRLREALHQPELVLEHVGSTAVPDLPANPVIDMLLEAQLPISAHLLAQLTQAGYFVQGDPQGDSPVELHRLRPDGSRWFQLTLLPTSHPRWQEKVAFRDRLRADALIRQAYAALKYELAFRHVADREAYRAGKAAFARAALSAA